MVNATFGKALKIALQQRFPLMDIASYFAFHLENETDLFLLLGDGEQITLIPWLARYPSLL